MTARKPSVYNIPPGHGFADALALGILAGAKDDPLSFSSYTVLLPSRRACRTLRDAFLRLSGGDALLLPRLLPLGDVDADEMAMHLAGDDDAEAALDLPLAVEPLERQILLARLVEKTGYAQSFDQAVALARDLARLLDEVQTEGLGFSALETLVPEKFSAHWQQTLAFLKILTEHWPAILEERGAIDAGFRRNLLAQAQIDAWTKNPPQSPVIAAAATGAGPKAVELLCLVARLPQGKLVLPGLDVSLDAQAWEMAGEDHPQYGIKKILEKLGVGRGDVTPWPVTARKTADASRMKLLSEALRPAASAEKWRSLTSGDISPRALENFTRIDCDTSQEEADVIALILRETLEEKGKTAALVTPDRRLARRVALALRRWGIDIDDSGGQPVTDLPVGSWLMLTAEMAQEKLSPVTLLSFLKHPFMAAGLPPDELRGMVYLLDEIALRGPRPAPGFKGLRDAIAALSPKRAGDAAKLSAWLDKIEPQIAPFAVRMAKPEATPCRDILQEHLRLAEDLAATETKTGGQRLWTQEAGDAASTFMADLHAASSAVPDLLPAHYVSLLGTLLKGITVRPRFGAHSRLSILGQIESRMLSADRVILGGLNEGIWPALPAHDPWMSRVMRSDFGLPAPERELGLSAHDFTQAACLPEVFLTRARKMDGTPTVPARWLLRIETVLAAVGLSWPKKGEVKYRAWARDLDRPAEIRPVSRPAPTPPADARPKKLRVTSIETWMRDPYQIYAQYILNLNALDPLDADPGAAERGTFIHEALEDFIKAYPKDLPDNAVEKLQEFGRQALEKMRIPPEVEAFWWPRFEKIAGIFIAQEREWREEASPFRAEISGTLDIDGLTLTGKADRIDKCHDGSFAIIDYKSGYAPDNSDVKAGLAPQLPLEALMLERGAFADITGTASKLVYWKVTGSGAKPVEFKLVSPKDYPVADMIVDAEEGLRSLIARFADPATPYLSQPRADAKPRFSDYEHLARVREWSVSGESEDAA